MAYGYIISKQDLSVVDIFTATDYTIELDKEFSGKSTISLCRQPSLDTGDFIFLKDDDGKIFYIGLVDTLTNESDTSSYTINAVEKESIFDQKIIVANDDLIAAVGIEDFIADTIKREFVASDDTFLNLDYIDIEVLTHTPVYAAVSTDTGGIYNFLTYLGNAREYYGIFLDFDFSGGRLKITISKKEQSTLRVDASVTDVTNYTEDYSVDALAKLTVIWKIPDTEDDDGNITVGDTTILHFYLLADRTITTDVDDPNRAKGKIDVIYCECEAEEEAIQTARNEFAGNAYEHSVTADILRTSRIYPADELYIGHTCQIKTKGYGVRKSFVSSVSYSQNSAFTSVKFGNMAITLIEKLRKERVK